MQAAVESADSSFKKMLEPKAEILAVEQFPAQQLFTPASVPSSVSARYASEDVTPPPNFASVEAAMSEAEHVKHGRCDKIYSDPLFFFSEWQKQEMARLDIVEAERAQKKAEKKARRAKEKALKQNQRGLQKTVTAKKQLNWRNRYVNDDIGGTKVVDTGPSPSLNSLVSKTTMNSADMKLGAESRGGVQQALRAGGGGQDYGEPDSVIPPAPNKPAPPMKPAAGGGDGPPARAAPPAPPGGGARPAPPPKPAAGGGPPAPPGRPAPPAKPGMPPAPPQPQYEEPAYQEQYDEAPQGGGARPPPPARPAPPPRKPAPPVPQGYQDPAEVNPYYTEPAYEEPAAAQRPPPPARPAPPPEPEKPKVPQSALSMSVLAGIQGGGASMLKKAAPVEKKIDPRMNMLASLKAGGAGLKKVAQDVIDKNKAEAAGAAKADAAGAGGMMAGVNAILERRKFLEAESDSDSGSDDDWE
jgi:hypothetical protein